MSLDRIEKLLKAHEVHTERTNRDLLLELRKMQEEVDYLRKLNNFEALKRDAVFYNPDNTTWEVMPSGYWIKHDSDTMPDDLSPTQIIEVRTGERSWRKRADVVMWRPGKAYRVIRDKDGAPYCADVDLEPWAEYVATDMDGIVHQYASTPEWCVDDRMWNNTRGGWKKIPEYSARLYRKNVPASENLMRVWRDV